MFGCHFWRTDGWAVQLACEKQNVVVRRRKDEDDRYTVNIPDTTLDPIGDGTTCDCVNKHDILNMLQYW